MAEPLSERIPAAIKTRLEAIVSDDGLNYWFTPAQVARFCVLTTDAFNTLYDTVYVVSPDRIERRTHVGREIDRELNLDLSLLTKLKLAVTEKPFNEAAYIRWQLQNRMAADVEKALCGGDLTLGGLSYNVEILGWDMSAENTFADGWAIVFGRVRVSYRTLRDAA